MPDPREQKSPFARHAPPLLALMALLVISPAALHAHGSVTNEDDVCAIRIGYFRAHFKIYLPKTRGHEQYCEDLPEAGESVFVMEYIHRGLGDIPIDFRIIRNVTGLGEFTQVGDIDRLEDLESITELHVPAAPQPDVYTVMHDFTEPGEYVGIVTAQPPGAEAPLRAVFPFAVGFTGFGYWPLIALILVVLQLQYLYMSGRLPIGRRSRLTSVKSQ